MTLQEVSRELARRLGNIFRLTRRARVRVMAVWRGSRMIRAGAISYCFTSISTARPAVAAAPVIKLAGQRSL